MAPEKASRIVMYILFSLTLLCNHGHASMSCTSATRPVHCPYGSAHGLRVRQPLDDHERDTVEDEDDSEYSATNP